MAHPIYLVSACLAGRCCRYDGRANEHPLCRQLVQKGLAIPVCPECDGGLPTPRPPAEIQGDRVITCQGQDVTEAYEKGAQIALETAQKFGISKAILKARSPSCGSGQIYDGTFSHRLVPGIGVTCALLNSHGIQVYSEEELAETFTD